MTKTASEPADKRHAEMQQAVGNGSGIHDVGRNDEQRHRKQQEPVKQTLHHGFARDRQILTSNTKIDHDAGNNGIGNWGADGRCSEQGKQPQYQFKAHHAPPLPDCDRVGGVVSSGDDGVRTRAMARQT